MTLPYPQPFFDNLPNLMKNFIKGVRNFVLALLFVAALVGIAIVANNAGIDIPSIILILASFVIVLLIIVVLIAIAGFILAGHHRIFTKIENNHMCCGENDGQFYSFYGYAADKIEVLKAFEKNAKVMYGNGFKTHPDYIERKDLLTDRFITNDNRNFLCELLVKWFNLHFMTFNPFVTLRPIAVIKAHINAENKEGKISDIISVGVENAHELFLRVKWPRAVFINNLELKHNVQIDLVTTCSEFTVSDPWLIYFKNQQISRFTDFRIKAAMINILGQMELKTENGVKGFEDTQFTADNQAFTEQVARTGFGEIGICVTGKFEIVEWDLGGSQQLVKEQQQKLAVATARVETETKEGQAEAARMIEKAKGEAKRFEEIRKAIAGDPHTAMVLAAEKAGTVILGGGQVLPTLPITPTPKGTP